MIEEEATDPAQDQIPEGEEEGAVTTRPRLAATTRRNADARGPTLPADINHATVVIFDIPRSSIKLGSVSDP